MYLPGKLPERHNHKPSNFQQNVLNRVEPAPTGWEGEWICTL